jgi:hypothetical protein
MSGTSFHDLRHFFASQLIANGETARMCVIRWAIPYQNHVRHVASVPRTRGRRAVDTEGDDEARRKNGTGGSKALAIELKGSRSQR